MAKEKLSSEQELEALRNRVAELEQEKETVGNSSERYLKEIQDLKKAQNKGLSNVQIKEIQDHKRVSLWHVSGHNIGKRVGPIHPASAEDTFLMFAGAGIKLSMNKPTEEFIDNYKKSSEYKKFAAREETRRAAKNRSRKESEVERLTQAVVKMSGVKETNRILSPSEVGSK